METGGSPIFSTLPIGSAPSKIVITSQLLEQPLHSHVMEEKCISPTSHPLNFVGISVYWWFSIASRAAPIAPIVWWLSGTTTLCPKASSKAFDNLAAIYWMFAATQIRVLKPTPQSDGVQRWVLWLVIRWWCHGREPNTQGQERVPAPFPPGALTVWEDGHYGEAGPPHTLQLQAPCSGTLHMCVLQSLRNK